MFITPAFDKNNSQMIASINGRNKEMLMDITVHRLLRGEELIVCEQDMESAILLLQGKLELEYDQHVYTVERKNMFKDLPTCLHICKDTAAIVTALEDSEVLLQSTENQNEFKSRLYLPGEVEKVTSCEGIFDDTARREVITIFDYYNAPYSNMVLGEIFVPQGRWFSYIPHHHPQPEVYYYRLEREEGFGACFIDDKAYVIKNGSCGAFLGGQTHSQVTAPGYPMYCCWMIRHLENNPWKRTRIDDERYTHLLKK
ncbi:MAG: 5-deoxy-glucuronate isomerase [Bacillota bacterium]